MIDIEVKRVDGEFKLKSEIIRFEMIKNGFYHEACIHTSVDLDPIGIGLNIDNPQWIIKIKNKQHPAHLDRYVYRLGEYQYTFLVEI